MRHNVMDPCISCSIKDPEIGGSLYSVDPETVGMWTWETDMDKNHIFEGDILRKPGHPEDDVIVEWYDGAFRYKAIHGSYYTGPMTYLHECFNAQTASWRKIVGNIYDNPPEL